MDETQQHDLDVQVQQALQALEASGETASVESVARTIKRRTADVLDSIKRLTRGTPALDVDTPPVLYSEVVAAAQRVTALEAARQEAEQVLTARESLLTQTEAAAADALIAGREPPNLTEARQAIQSAIETVRLFELALSTAKRRHAEALAAAQAQHWAVQWQAYQEAIRAFDTALGQAYDAQERARQVWNAIGQVGEVPMLKGPLANWQPYFHTFLADILSTAPEQVQRGTSYAGVRPTTACLAGRGRKGASLGYSLDFLIGGARARRQGLRRMRDFLAGHRIKPCVSLSLENLVSRVDDGIGALVDTIKKGARDER